MAKVTSRPSFRTRMTLAAWNLPLAHCLSQNGHIRICKGHPRPTRQPDLETPALSRHRCHRRHLRQGVAIAPGVQPIRLRFGFPQSGKEPLTTKEPANSALNFEKYMIPNWGSRKALSPAGQLVGGCPGFFVFPVKTGQKRAFKCSE